MVRKCINCNKEFSHGVSGNMIIFCPYCKKSTDSISDFGFGPIVPCDIYLGDEIIASIPAMNELISLKFGLKRALSGKYANLEVYHEAEKIIGELLLGQAENDITQDTFFKDVQHDFISHI